MGGRSSVWVVGMQLGIRRAKTAEEGKGKEGKSSG
jgi:hypothetical protein